MCRIIAVVTLCLVCSTLLLADEVYLINGDKITGKITTMADGKMTVESSLAGKITIDMNNVSTFKTAEPIEIKLKDGNSFKQQVDKSDNSKFIKAPNQTVIGPDIDLAAIAAINPPPKEQPKWHGNISGALTSTHGNTKMLSESFSAIGTLRRENDRITLSTDYFYGKQKVKVTDSAGNEIEENKVTQDDWKIGGKYDYFFDKKLFAFSDTRYERDRIAELKMRLIEGVGVGYQWFESDPFNFATNVGLAWRYESYTNGTDHTSGYAVQLGYHLDKKLGKNLIFVNDLTYYPSIEDSGDYLLTTTAELRAKLTDVLFTNFKTIFDYDSTPAEGRGKTDVKYILGIGVNF